MDVFSRLLDRWLAVTLALHTAIMGGLWAPYCSSCTVRPRLSFCGASFQIRVDVRQSE